jgi:allantoin racemase
MAATIYVINPNSTEAVTEGIRAAVGTLALPHGTEVDCLTLTEGPSAIETQRDIDHVVAPLCRMVLGLEKKAAAFVIACFSDPGLYSLRELTRKPVLGIGESGMLTAMTLGQRIGVISILPVSIPRHHRYFAAMGITSRIAADQAVNLGVRELADAALTRERMLAVGQKLRDEHGADVLVMGCAGMARYRALLEAELKVPVVEPTLAAIAMAIGQTMLGWRVRTW